MNVTNMKSTIVNPADNKRSISPRTQNHGRNQSRKMAQTEGGNHPTSGFQEKNS